MEGAVLNESHVGLGGGDRVGGDRASRGVNGDLLYFRHEVARSTDVRLCPNPYDIPADAPPPRSRDEAHDFWQKAYDESQVREEQTISVLRVTAEEWTANGREFSIRADLKADISM